MGNYNRENQSSGNRNFGKPRFNNDRPDMHKATCASCGKICEVPFRPTGSKPVYCKNCFQNIQGADSHRLESRSYDRPRSEERQMYDAVCSNCGANCQIPFRPSPGRDIFCSRCFEKNEGSETHRPSFNRNDNRSRTKDTPNYKAQFEVLNAKMDKILNLLNPIPTEVAPLKSAIDEKVIEEIVEEIKEETKEAAEKKPKKEKAAMKKSTTKTKKETSPKKK